MPRTRSPRRGSMQYWPRKRAKRIYARIRSWPKSNDVKALGFAGYKAGMTHVMIIDNRAKSLTKGQEIFCPVTLIECPPLKVASIRFYKKDTDGLRAVSDVLSESIDKDLERKIQVPKKRKKTEYAQDFDDLSLVVHTQPKLTGIGKKKPELFEIPVGGSKEDKLKYAKEKLGKDIMISEVFKEGEQLDLHAITKGKGTQGAVKRFGIAIRNHKSEKTKRGPGSLGGWRGQGHIMYRVSHAGKMGFHQRIEYNKWLLKIGKDANEINQNGGILHYGNIKNDYVIVKGSVNGPVKRCIRFNHAIRENSLIPKDAPRISYISTESKQGR